MATVRTQVQPVPVYRTKVSDWMFFFGLLLTLMGVYGLIRVADINRRGVPYPLNGVMPATVLTPTTNYGFTHESDCDPYPQLYYEADNKTLRQPTEQESGQAQQLKDRCVNEFNEDRSRQRQNDRNESVFLVFVGMGL